MNSFARAHNRYLDPPEEPEAIFCDDCGQEMTEIDNFGGQREMKCVNNFCPSKFPENSIEREMAEMLICANETVKSLERQIKALKQN